MTEDEKYEIKERLISMINCKDSVIDMRKNVYKLFISHL